MLMVTQFDTLLMRNVWFVKNDMALQLVASSFSQGVSMTKVAGELRAFLLSPGSASAAGGR